MICDHCQQPRGTLILVEELDAKLCYNCLDKLSRAAPSLLAALEELLAARDMQHRIGLWPESFPHIGRSPKEPKGAARIRFEVWYTRATCRVIKAEDAARAAIAKARPERSE